MAFSLNYNHQQLQWPGHQSYLWDQGPVSRVPTNGTDYFNLEDAVELGEVSIFMEQLARRNATSTYGSPLSNTCALFQRNTYASHQSNTYASPQSNTHVSPQGNTYASPQSNTYASPQSNTHVSPQGNTHVSPQGNTHVSPLGNTHVSPLGNTHVSPLGNTHVSPLGNTHVSPQSNTYALPQSNTHGLSQNNGCVAPVRSNSRSLRVYDPRKMRRKFNFFVNDVSNTYSASPVSSTNDHSSPIPQASSSYSHPQQAYQTNINAYSYESTARNNMYGSNANVDVPLNGSDGKKSAGHVEIDIGIMCPYCPADYYCTECCGGPRRVESIGEVIDSLCRRDLEPQAPQMFIPPVRGVPLEQSEGLPHEPLLIPMIPVPGSTKGCVVIDLE